MKVGADLEEGVRMGYRPSLDGLRTVAVAAVVAYHYVDHPRLAGAFLGVDLFFVLSGFLITRLLLEEFHARSQVDLSRFYIRRIARLLPALLIVCAALILDGLTINSIGSFGEAGKASIAALLYVTNWVRAFGADTTLPHTWSLSIEEQFYLIWPIMFAMAARCRGARGVVAVAITALVLSIGQMAIRSAAGVSAFVLYNGTESHGATMLMAGCAGAALVPLSSVAHGATRAAAAVGALIVASMVLTAEFESAFYYQGGFALAAASFLAIITWSLTSTGPLTAALSSRPMSYLGRLSYAIYLWHYPLEFVMEDLFPDAAWSVQRAASVIATLALAVASYHLVERPARKAITSRFAA